MTKRQLIDRITTINVSAHPSFLASFDEDDLQAYLEHLHVLQQPRLSGGPGRFEKYFAPAPRPQFIYDTPTDADKAEILCHDEPLSADHEGEETGTDTGRFDVANELDSYQSPRPDARSEDDGSSPERPLAPVMAGAREADKSQSHASADDESDTWLF